MGTWPREGGVWVRDPRVQPPGSEIARRMAAPKYVLPVDMADHISNLRRYHRHVIHLWIDVTNIRSSMLHDNTSSRANITAHHVQAQKFPQILPFSTGIPK